MPQQYRRHHHETPPSPPRRWAAWATRSISGCDPMIVLRPSRKIGWSSTLPTTPQDHFLLHYLQRSRERRRQMRPQIAGTYAFKCALLFLASAVFSWGLQAKLSLYKPRQSPSTITVAKLLTERRSAQTMARLEKALNPDTAWETLKLFPLLALAQAILILTFGFYQVEMNLCRSRRLDFQDPHLTQRPPPAFC